MDYTWAKKLGMVRRGCCSACDLVGSAYRGLYRKPANFISSISDDRGEDHPFFAMTAGSC